MADCPIFESLPKKLSIINIFKWLSKNSGFNFEKDVLLNLHKETNNKKVKVNIKNINFLDYNGYTISKSTLYKALKSLCDKNLITHLGTKRSSIYKLN